MNVSKLRKLKFKVKQVFYHHILVTMGKLNKARGKKKERKVKEKVNQNVFFLK